MATTSIRVSNSIVALVVETRTRLLPAFGFLVIVAEVVETRLQPLSFFTGRIPFLLPNLGCQISSDEIREIFVHQFIHANANSPRSAHSHSAMYLYNCRIQACTWVLSSNFYPWDTCLPYRLTVCLRVPSLLYKGQTALHYHTSGRTHALEVCNVLRINK